MVGSETKIRLFVNAPLAGGESISPGDLQCHYLVHVMRVREGDPIAVFNGKDGEWLATVEQLHKNLCVLTVREQRTPQAPERGPWLAFAPLKKTRTQFVVEKATELGVSRLYPVFTANTSTNRVNVTRLRSYAIEAAEQCGRLTVPEIAEPTNLDDLLSQWSENRRLIVMDCSSRGEPLLEILWPMGYDVRRGREQPPGFLIGPEGGFTKTELDDLATLPFVAMATLSSRVLRAETAALATLSCWQAIVESESSRETP